MYVDWYVNMNRLWLAIRHIRPHNVWAEWSGREWTVLGTFRYKWDLAKRYNRDR